MNACPHCGGTLGYSFRTTVVYVMAGEWGTKPTGDPSGAGSDSLVECRECGQKMRSTTAVGGKHTDMKGERRDR